MQFQSSLSPGILIQRYKRFLADIITIQGEPLRIYCPNPGAMTGCGACGDRIWYSTSFNLKRRYTYTWEITQTRMGSFICVNALRANQLVREAIISDWIPEFYGYKVKKSEATYGKEGSRIDFILQLDDRRKCYVEVKSVTLAERDHGYFPDAVTLRGQKHLRELMTVASSGKRAVLFFAVLNSAIKCVSPAYHIDLKYAQLLTEAKAKGVEIFAYKAEFSTNNIRLNQSIPIILYGNN